MLDTFLSFCRNEGFRRRSERACSAIDLREADRSGMGGLDTCVIPAITCAGGLKRHPASGLLARGSASIDSLCIWPFGAGDGVWADLTVSGLPPVLVGSGLLTGLSVCELLVDKSGTGLLADLIGSGPFAVLVGSGLRTGLSTCEPFVDKPAC